MRRSRPIRLLATGLFLSLAATQTTAQGPTLRLSPSSVESEGEVQAIGAGFCAEARCSPITIRLQGWTAIDGIAPDEKGAFEASFVAEAGPGTYRVTASQSLGVPAGTHEVTTITASAELVVESGPRLIIDPPQARVGDRVTVWALDVEEGDPTSLVLKLGEEVVVEQMKAREDGAFEASFTVRVDPGVYEVTLLSAEAADETPWAVGRLIVGPGSRTPGTEPEPQPPVIE